MSVSDSLVFQPKPASIAGTTHRQTVPAYNGSSFDPQQTILVNVPCGRRAHYLNTRMSYLRFKLKNKGTGSFATDFTAASVIQSIAIYHGSNLLEQIHGYSALFHLFLDLQDSEESVKRVGSILYGTNPDSSKPREGGVWAAGADVVVCLPILSGIIGGLQSKYLPTGVMTGGDLRLEITLAALNTGVVNTSTSDPKPALSWAVHDVELQLEYVEVNSEVDRMIQQANPRYVISFESFANYTNTIDSTEGQINKLIPARFSSLKTLYSIFRKQTDITAGASKSSTARINPDLKNWQYSIAGELIPSTPVREDVESFAELQKALHVFGAANNTSDITATSYYQKDSASNCSFAIGENLETLSHKSTLTESGKNTLNVNAYLLGTIGGSNALQIDTYAHFDAILVIENGIATSAF